MKLEQEILLHALDFSYCANFMYYDSFLILCYESFKITMKRVQMSTVLGEAIKLFQKAYIDKDFYFK